MLFYQDFNEQFEGHTQLQISSHGFISVVLSGFQRYFCMQYTTSEAEYKRLLKLFYQDVNEQFCCKSTEKIGNMQIYTNIFCYFNKKYYLCTNKFEGYTQ